MTITSAAATSGTSGSATATGATPVRATSLPVHPRPVGWRAGAAAALVDTAVADLRAGRSPAATVLALADLGGHQLPRGLAGAEELDRRLTVAVSEDPKTDEDAVVEAFLKTLTGAAVAGCPHPGEWVASSVDVVPCAVHGYEDGPVDCLGRFVRAHLAGPAGRHDPVTTGTGRGALAQQVWAVAHPGTSTPGAGAPAHDRVLATLWLGVATVAAWRTYAAAA